MIGVELIAGYLAAWAWRKARRVAGRADDRIDQALDAGVDRLHDAVRAKLGDDPALRQLEDEAGANLDQESVSPRTRQRVQLAVEDAVERDPGFAEQVRAILAEVERSTATAGHHGLAAGRDISAPGGVIAGTIHGSVSIGHPPKPDPGSA